MEKHYPILFNQNDYGAVDLGTSTTETIAAGGCFDSSLAMKANYYGHQVTPITLNQLFVNKGVYQLTDLLPDNALAQVFPDIKYLQTIDYEPIPTDLNNIKTLLSDLATTLTIRINFGGGNMHFVEAVACDGTSLHIANPISGQIEDFTKRYGNPITAKLHILVYQGPVAQQLTQPEVPSPLAQRFTQAIQKSNNFDTLSDFLGISQGDRITPDAARVAIEKYKYLQQEVEKLSNQIQGASQQVANTSSGTQVVQPPILPATSGTSLGTSPITFSTGKTAVSGTQPQQSTTGVKQTNSQPMQSGRVTPKEFLKALFRILFI